MRQVAQLALGLAIVSVSAPPKSEQVITMAAGPQTCAVVAAHTSMRRGRHRISGLICTDDAAADSCRSGPPPVSTSGSSRRSSPFS
jgi:hypothetical protein